MGTFGLLGFIFGLAGLSFGLMSFEKINKLEKIVEELNESMRKLGGDWA